MTASQIDSLHRDISCLERKLSDAEDLAKKSRYDCDELKYQVWKLRKALGRSLDALPPFHPVYLELRPLLEKD